MDEILDLSNKEQFENHLQKYGFFYYYYDNDNKKIIDDMLEYSKKYFALPQEMKERELMGQDGLGYAATKMFKLRKDIVEMKESYSQRHNSVIYQNNPVTQKYNKLLSTIGMEISNKIINFLDIKPEYCEKLVENTCETLTMIHYPVINNTNNICGCAEHTDWGYITILHTNENGLQIKIDDNWVDLPIKPNHFIINIGDMLELLSGGKYKSTVHRVMTAKEKYSIVYFFEPDLDCIIVSPDNKKVVVYGDYLGQKLIQAL